MKEGGFIEEKYIKKHNKAKVTLPNRYPFGVEFIRRFTPFRAF